MKNGILLKKKKKKKFTSLGRTRKLSLLITGPTRPSIIHLRARLHEHNLTFEKVFNAYDISIKKLLQGFNKRKFTTNLSNVKLIIFPPFDRSMTRWKLFNINVHNCTPLFRAIGSWLCLAQPLDDLGLHD